MARLPRTNINDLHRNISRWFARERRKLLWRTTFNPYKILVSEIMLQQTQVSRVKIKLPEFLGKFPTVAALAHSSKSSVVRRWQGLGYNSRAVRLWKSATIIMEEHNGRVPSSIDELRRLPGVGKYTSHAVACFAYKQRVAVVDVNVQRVLSRYFRKMKTFSDTCDEETIWKIAEQIVPKDAYTWNQALMDLGAMICTARRPSCEICPIAKRCASRNRMKQPAKSGLSSGEPKYDGMPVRLWRGRIVEALRLVDGAGSLSLLRLGYSIKKDFTQDEIAWLDGLVAALVRDGIVRRIGNTKRARVSLANE